MSLTCAHSCLYTYLATWWCHWPIIAGLWPIGTVWNTLCRFLYLLSFAYLSLHMVMSLTCVCRSLTCWYFRKHFVRVCILTLFCILIPPHCDILDLCLQVLDLFSGTLLFVYLSCHMVMSLTCVWRSLTGWYFRKHFVWVCILTLFCILIPPHSDVLDLCLKVLDLFSGRLESTLQTLHHVCIFGAF